MLSGWGRFPVLECAVARAHMPGEAAALASGAATVIARGNGRAYGDAALNPELTMSMLGLDRMRDFDRETGVLTCEAGVTLDEILRVFVPRGWFPPVMPGTRYVSVGGMIAADVHGKNHHHRGTFGRHVVSLELLEAEGRVTTCSDSENCDLFHATQGGMGLTGTILSARIRLMRIATAYIREETVPAANLEAAMAVFEDSQDREYSVAWIDCLATGAARGRALISRGGHAPVDDLPAKLRTAPLRTHPSGGKSMPVDAPQMLLNGLSVRMFNAAYHARGRAKAGGRVVHYDPFFFPLDGIREWNRLYGRRGFAQFQCVLPRAASAEGLRALLDRIAASGQGSFLAVLKLLGPEGKGYLSFPMEGYTLALDFPMRAKTPALIAELDRITLDHGGRIYLAKDSCTTADHIRAGYPRLPDFTRVRAETGAIGRFQSALSRRLSL